MIIAKERMKENPKNCGRAVIDVDCSNVVHLVKNRAMGVVEETTKFLMEWVLCGGIVVPICDGDTRSISKIQSHKNRAKRQKKKIEAIISRQKLNKINRQLKSDGLTVSELNAATTQRKDLEGEIKRAETQSTNPVPTNFPKMLEKELIRLSSYKPTGKYGGCVGKVTTGKFQADGVIAGRYATGMSNLIISTDGDYPAFSNDNCLALSSFKGENLTITSTSKATVEKEISYLPPENQRFPQMRLWLRLFMLEI